MVIISTRAAEVNIHALSPLSIFGWEAEAGVAGVGGVAEEGGVSGAIAAPLADGVIVD
jgi:hypothetical protein